MRAVLRLQRPPTLSASFRVSALNSGEWIIRFFLLVMVHLISDCTHLTQCPKLLVRITLETTLRLIETDTVSMLAIADMAF